MEKMPYRSELDGPHDVRFQQPLVRASLEQAARSDWRDSLPKSGVRPPADPNGTIPTNWASR